MQRLLAFLEIPVLVAVPASLAVCAALQLQQAALLTMVVVLAAVVVFLAGYEASRPGLRQIMPSVVLAALASAGRILFAPIPSVQPVSAVCVLAGVVFGRRCGFMVGALSALVSNFFLGQGPWTPWQMYAWGLVGYFAGVLGQAHAFQRKPVVYIYGFLASYLYSALLNAWYVIGYVSPITPVSVGVAYLAALPLDTAHAVSTVVFLLLIFAPWQRKLERIRTKYDLRLQE